MNTQLTEPQVGVVYAGCVGCEGLFHFAESAPRVCRKCVAAAKGAPAALTRAQWEGLGQRAALAARRALALSDGPHRDTPTAHVARREADRLLEKFLTTKP